MRDITEIIGKYTDGKATLEETNSALKEAGAGFHLDPTRNTFTGWGLLDSGTGTLDKVQVKDGHLVNCDMGESYALCIIGGKTFVVKGDALAEKE